MNRGMNQDIDIRYLEVSERGCGGMQGILLAQNTDQWQLLRTRFRKMPRNCWVHERLVCSPEGLESMEFS
jgi:hypothetical protein